MPAIVLVEKIKEDLVALESQVIQSIMLLSLKEEIGNAKSVFIKPNLTYHKYKEGVTTRREFIECIISALIQINCAIRIYIGEGEGGYNSFSISEAFKNMGFLEIEKKFPNVRIINLSKVPSRQIIIDTCHGSCELELPKLFFDEIDFSISCPVPKVHCMTKVSLSFKNQWGCLPDVMRLRNHYMFDDLISKISDILKFKYAVLDGKYALNINGPIVGNSVETNWFVASNSLGAFDMIVSEMMGFHWRKIRHLKKASKYGYLPKREQIQVFGDIESLKRKLMLKRYLWNYPALAAFHSKKLTNLFYCSRLAKPLHDLMYIFRRRPIDIG